MLRYGLLNPPPMFSPAASVATPSLPTLTYGQFGLPGAPGTLYTSSGTVGAKAAPLTIGTLSDYIDGMLIRLRTTTSRSWLFDILVDGVVKVADYHVLTVAQGTIGLEIPGHIAAGSTVSIQAATTAGSQGLTVSIVAYQSNLPYPDLGITPLVAVGAVGSSGQLIDLTTPAWNLLGTLGANIRGFIPYLATGNDTTRTTSDYEVLIGTGEAGAEVPILEFAASSSTAMVNNESYRPILMPIDAGTKVSMKITPTAGADTLLAQLMLIGA